MQLMFGQVIVNMVPLNVIVGKQTPILKGAVELPSKASKQNWFIFFFFSMKLWLVLFQEKLRYL